MYKTNFTTQEAFLEELGGYISMYSQGAMDAVVLTYFVANYLVQSKNAKVLDKIPTWLEEKVRELADVYERDGELIVYTSQGSADKSELGRELLELLRDLGPRE